MCRRFGTGKSLVSRSVDKFWDSFHLNGVDSFPKQFGRDKVEDGGSYITKDETMNMYTKSEDDKHLNYISLPYTFHTEFQQGRVLTHHLLWLEVVWSRAIFDGG